MQSFSLLCPENMKSLKTEVAGDAIQDKDARAAANICTGMADADLNVKLPVSG